MFSPLIADCATLKSVHEEDSLFRCKLLPQAKQRAPIGQKPAHASRAPIV
jgi:hypothetical protein